MMRIIHCLQSFIQQLRLYSFFTQRLIKNLFSPSSHFLNFREKVGRQALVHLKQWLIPWIKIICVAAFS